MRLAAIVCLNCFLLASAIATFATAGPAIRVEILTAATVPRFTWSVDTATYPGGLNLKIGEFVGNLVISTNYTKTAAGSVGFVSGRIVITNPGDTDLQLTVVQAVIQQPAAAVSPVRSIAECPETEDGYVSVNAGQTLDCPFAQALGDSSVSPVVVQAQAVLAGGSQLSAAPITAPFHSRMQAASNNTAVTMALGQCAALSDTFMSGELYLAPAVVAAGVKLPSLGAAGAVCDTTNSLYRVTFGPYAAGDIKCGAYQVMNVARATPLGGDQPPTLASSLVLVSITGCPAATAPPPSPPAAPSSSNMRLPADSIIYGAPAASTGSAASANPYTTSTGGAASTTTSGSSSSGTGATAPAPAPAAPTYVPAASMSSPAAVPTPSPPPSPTDEYYYTYEYEAQIPTTARRRTRRRRLLTSSNLVPGTISAVSMTTSMAAEPQVVPEWMTLQLASGRLTAAEGQLRQGQPPGLQPEYGRQMAEGVVALPSVMTEPSKQGQPHNTSLGASEVVSPEPVSVLQQLQQHIASPRRSQQSVIPATLELRLQEQPQLLQQRGLLTAAVARAPDALQEAAPWTWDSERVQHLQELGSSVMAEGSGVGLGQGAELFTNSSDQPSQPRVQVVGPNGAADMLQTRSGHQQHQRKTALQIELLHANGSTPWHQPQSPQTMRSGRRQLMGRRLQQRDGPSEPQFIAASTFYGPAAVAAPGQPSIAFNAMQVGFSVMSAGWQPAVTVSPAAVTLQIGQSAVVQYSVKVTRSELPRRTLLRGSFLIQNPQDSPVKLSEVAVEAPAAGKPSWAYVTASCGQGGTLSSILTTLVTVPAKGQVVCTFTASYPAAAPDNGVLFARAVTDAGKQLVSNGFAFTRPAGQVAAAQAAKLGSCAMFSDTFLSQTDSPQVIMPSKLPASGTKAPAAATAASAGTSKGGLLLCNNATYTYSVKVGPFQQGQCGQFLVVNHLRVHPLNGSISGPSSATGSVAVDVTGCKPVSTAAAAFPVAAAALNQNSDLATQLAPITLTLEMQPYKDITSYAWNITSTPTASVMKMQYQQTLRATFMVQYKRSAAAAGRAFSGTVTIRNPNLLESVSLVEVQVELYKPGSTGPVFRTWANCPRDSAGIVTVPGQLLGSGQLVCSWNMRLLSSSTYATLLDSSSGAQLLAVAVASSGLEYVSRAQPLSSIAKSASTDAEAVDSCMALSNTFQAVGRGNQLLLQPSSSGTGSSLLAGESGGGRATDVVCNSLSVSYGVTYGPLTKYQCGIHKTTNLAIASPTTVPGLLSSTASTAAIAVTGCPGALASLSVTGLQLQLVESTQWTVAGRAPGAAAPVKAAVGQTLDVSFGLKYTAAAAVQQRQLAGSILISATGSAPLTITNVMVEVTPLDPDSITALPLVTWSAVCPGVSITGDVTVASGSSISCSFVGAVPGSLVGYGGVLARMQLSDSSEFASTAMMFDFSQQPMQTINRQRCAIVSDHFLMGDGLLLPSKTTRPAAAAAPTQVCNSQSVSFVATVGPITQAQCSQLLTVINLSRVSPVPVPSAQTPLSYATVARFNVTGGCHSQT